ncbi:MAG TPA: hypothetical protein VG323_21000 [Thermoanaerobaculia bacterium]|nr:hypothetical protein [Thermoanaerobaculia bacterium]
MSSTKLKAADTTDISAQSSALLDQIEALIPGYTKPDSARARSVAINARFAQELITPTIAAVNNYEPLRQHNLFDVEQARRALVLRDELRPIQQRVAAIAEAIAFTIDSQLAEAGIEALQAYRWSQHHLRHHQGDGLRPYVDEMKIVVKKAIGRRAKAKAGSPAPQGAMADLLEKAHAHDAEEDQKVTA